MTSCESVCFKWKREFRWRRRRWKSPKVTKVKFKIPARLPDLCRTAHGPAEPLRQRHCRLTQCSVRGRREQCGGSTVRQNSPLERWKLASSFEFVYMGWIRNSFITQEFHRKQSWNKGEAMLLWINLRSTTTTSCMQLPLLSILYLNHNWRTLSPEIKHLKKS